MIQALYLITHLSSTLAAESIRISEQSNKISDNFNRSIKTGFTNRKPPIVINGIKVNGEFAKTGTIVVRTLGKSFITELLNEYHYGIVIGTDSNGEEHLIEMTDDRNVNILNKQKFIQPHNESHFKIYSRPQKDFLPEDIYKMAERFEYSKYSLLNLNCRDFVEYCIYGIEPERRSDVLNSLILGLNELGQKLNTFYGEFPESPEMMKFFNENNMKLKQQQLIIANNIKTKII